MDVITRSSRITSAQRRRRVAAAVADCLAWIVAIFIAVVLRFEFELTTRSALGALLLAAVAATLQLVLSRVLIRARGRHTYGSFDEVRDLGVLVVAEMLLLSAVVVLAGNFVGIPRTTVFLAFPFVLLMMFGIRYFARLLLDRSITHEEGAERALVVGAGYLSDVLLRAIAVDPASPIRPVGLLDDDPAKSDLRVRGIPVLGTTADVVTLAARTRASVLVIALARIEGTQMRQLTDRAQEAGLRVVVMPRLASLASGEASAADLRDISIEDLIGRFAVDTNVELIAGYITGRRVLVTGAGGSIGAELCRQLSKFGPSRLIMLDRDETGLQSAQLATSGRGLLDSDDVVLVDIRDPAALGQAFSAHRPEVVFHAAALKHLPMLEQYPDEAWKTNVLGTLNVLNAARSAGVETFINVSTDKAANPTSVLGHSKRMAEKLTAWAGEQTGHRYLSVRFGNVIGSRGSMLPTFRTLIEGGGPLTVTHPDVTRYFMTIPEACQLVIQAGAIGRSGEILILDMGEPVSILDVAKRMIAMSGKTIEIVFTGLRPGEKLHEELVGSRESLQRPFHEKIFHTRAESIAPEALDKPGWDVQMRTQPRENDTAVVGLVERERAESRG